MSRRKRKTHEIIEAMERVLERRSITNTNLSRSIKQMTERERERMENERIAKEISDRWANRKNFWSKG